jgi:hypothetical protein
VLGWRISRRMRLLCRVDGVVWMVMMKGVALVFFVIYIYHEWFEAGGGLVVVVVMQRRIRIHLD